MSLHTLAQHLQSAGRGDDKVLVHMTPGEVSGLQSLAMAHGGSLTTNPETGLPEAGFLSGILPTLLGAGLTVATGGAINPMTAGLIAGAAGTAITGNLGKGLMMGLGAYGGAGLAAGLGGAAAAAAPVASAAATEVAPAMAYGSLTPGAVAPSLAPTAALTPSTSGTFAGIQGTNVNAMFPGAPAPATPPVVSTTPDMSKAIAAAGGTSATQPAVAPSVESSIMDRLKTMGGRAADLITGTGDQADKEREEFLKKYKMPLIGAGLSTLMLSQEQQKMPSQQNVTNYQTFNPTYNRIAQSGGNYQAGPYTGTSERRYFADGGLADLPVEKMSQQASTGQNTNYPMANIRPYGYAVPRNNPISENVFKPMDYQNVDPYTGEQKLAGGGLASMVNMATGGFVSKLKAVQKPAEIKPKLQSTAAIDKKIASLEKYKNLDEVQGRYNDLQSQIKDLQEQKKNRAAESANAAKEYNAAIAQINKDKANRLKEVNADFSNRIKEIQADKGRPAKEKQAAIADIQREQQSAIAGVNTEFGDAIKNRQNDYNNFKKDYSASIKDFDTRIAAMSKEATPAKSAAAMAKQYQDAVAQRDKLVAANEAATNKAREQNESAMAKYNQYQDALNAEKQAWQEETGRKASGIQAIRPQSITKSLASSEDVKAKIAALEAQKNALPGTLSSGAERQEIQKQIDALKSGAAAEGYTPKYIKDKNGNLILSSEAPPITEFKPFTKVPGYDTTKRLMEEKDISAVFEDVAGRRPTKAEMEKFLGTQTTDAAIAQYAMNAPDVKAAMKYTDDDFKENFQYYIGRQPTSGELSAMKKANITNFNQMRNFLQQQPAYLKNLNTVAQQAFQAQQKSAEDALAEQARLAASLTPEQVSTAYRDVLGRMPTMQELNQYMGAQQTPQGLEGVLKGSQEYLGKLTQPLVPTPTVAAPKYAPGTVLEFTPQQQAAPGLGGITAGVQPTASGLQAPLTRGAVTLEGAMPLNPTFTEQMGLQTLATQAAEKAPQLQTGLQFAAAQPQNTFGFQPYAAQSPQSIEAILAALRAQQPQGVTQMAAGGYAEGGYHLGDYSDGGRLLKGPGNGTSDSIPASIGGRQPARLADGEFVIPARIVSELGNGSTDAGARELYAMMERIQRARGKTVGKNKVAVDAKARNMLPV